MKKSIKSSVWVMMLLFVSAFTGCETYKYGAQAPQPVYETPHWAPPVYSGIRYYYIPDIECYYDMYSREFIFLDRAQWVYSPALPYMYRDFDLDRSFIVIVNSRIYQPWMHHQYYVSHFPRYYYRDYYDHSNIPWVRGYDENMRRAVYWKENERDRARSWSDQNLRNDRQFRYSREDRQQQTGTGNQTVTGGEPRVNPPPANERNHALPPQGTKRPDQVITETEGTPRQPVNNPGPPVNNPGPPIDNPGPPATTPATETRRSTSTNYYGRPIGQPVKVERQMRNQSETGAPEDNRTKPAEPTKRSNSGRR